MKHNIVSKPIGDFLSLEQLTSFVPAHFHNESAPYISFQAYDYRQGRLKKQIIPLAHIDQEILAGYAIDLCQRINSQLEQGWNPFLATKQEGILLDEAFDEWLGTVKKAHKENLIRIATLQEYQSKIKNIRLYNSQRENPIQTLAEFDRRFIGDLLSHVYYERGNSYVTYNNYLRITSVFVSYCLEKGYIEKNPIEGLKTKHRNRNRKHRTIPKDDVDRIFKHIEIEDPHFLVACYLLMYCLIRPTEMSYIKIKDISVKRQTVYLDADHTKNKRSAHVTIPRFILELMIDLKIFNGDENRYLFSKGMLPGYDRITDKIFRDHWGKARKLTGSNPEYQFYHLKHTGITNYLKSNCDPLSVRDQARHSSIVITEMYTDQNLDGNPFFKNVSLEESRRI